jgi:hypothetical protein
MFKHRKTAMREMIASRSLGRAGISALVPYIAVLCVALLSGCTKFTDLQSPHSLRTPKPLATSEIPVVNWSQAREVHMLATEFAFSPNDPVFKAGVPYRLFIRNVGDNEHVLKGLHFLRAIAVHQIKLTEFTSHGDDGHGDKAIGPDKSDGVPELPPIKEGTRDLVAENNAEAIAEAQGGKSGKEAADPFAATDAEEDADDAGDGDEEAANPFAAKDDGDADEDASEAANPFAAKPDEESEDDAASDDQASDVQTSDDQNADDQADDKENVAAKIEDDDGDAEEEDGISKAQKTPAEEVDDDDDVVVAKPVTPAKPAEIKEIDWQPLDINRFAIPVGHEVSIEFVAVRPGTYRIYSADLKYAMTGMFGEAKIE